MSSLDKVLYPATGTTKTDVMHYYLTVAGVIIPQITGRPVTRKRWVDGVGTADEPGEVFFAKDLEESAPDWVPTGTIRHKTTTNHYPLIDATCGPAVLAWFSQVAALELHTPQWRFGDNGQPRNPDRLVLDLDPGEGVGLPECAEVARWCREILDGMGMTPYPVTSGSMGIHQYAGLDGSHNADAVSQVARELARALEVDHPGEVISSMKRSERAGKVFLDWSQNNGSKTTISPYSLRGRAHPTVAAPRTWEELDDPGLKQLTYEEVMERVADGIDQLAPLGAIAPDRLATYRSMRDPAKTAEPVPAEPPTPRAGEPTFVIQEHHARNLHWDFRLEHEGVLVSWAVPKGPPLDPEINRLAVQTEDHPLEYGHFEGTIAKGEYGAGEVSIWDAGTCELEKWREGTEVIAVLHGRGDGGLGGVLRRYALIHTGEKNWLLHLMKDQPATDRPDTTPVSLSELPSPMLATPGSPADIRLGEQDGEKWAFEMKWDGYRIIAGVGGGAVTLASRNGKDYTEMFPQLSELVDLVPGTAVLDGEVVVLDDRGRPDFGLLQSVATGDLDAGEVTLRYMVFDILQLDGRSLVRRTYDERREALRAAVEEGEFVTVPPAHSGTLAQAEKVSRELGLEGVVAKRRDATYLPGRRGSAWVKLKFQHHQEVVVVGARHGKGGRAGGIGSLLVAVPDEEGVLRYAGRVGTGFTDAGLRDVEKLLRPLERETPPVDDVPAEDQSDAWWVTPRLVGEVSVAGRTHQGRVRQASWRGWREDKDPAEVRWEVR